MKKIVFTFVTIAVALYANPFSNAVADYRKESYIRALNGFYEAAKNDRNAAAMFNIALMYEKGRGIKRDMRQALLWYRQAAEAGSVEAMYNLAILSEKNGDYKEAERWYVAAAKAGSSDAMNNLAVMYWRRETNDALRYRKVRMLLEEAAAAGNARASRNLERLRKIKF